MKRFYTRKPPRLCGAWAKGLRLIDERPRIGFGGNKIAFVHPSGMHGVLVELVEEVHHAGENK